MVSNQSYSRELEDNLGDISAQLSAIRAPNPEAIFIGGNTEDRYQFVTRAHEFGIGDVPYISPTFSILEIQRINAETPGAAERGVTFEVWLTDSDNRLVQEFVDGYRARYNGVPEDLLRYKFLLRRLKMQMTMKQLPFGMLWRRSEIFETVFGPFSFDEVGEASYQPFVAQVVDGVFVLLQ